jgi:FkbM family methyltransferase
MRQQLARTLGGTKLYRRYNRRFGKFDYRTIDFFIHEYSRTHKDIYFLQVGANDGMTWDPCYFFVRRDDWKGIVIEPQRQVFEEKLELTYKDTPGIQLMNVAVDTADGIKPLFRYSFASSRWATGLASFDRERLIDNFNSPYVQNNIEREHLVVSPNPDEYVTSELVSCLTFETILDAVHVDAIDFLITDVEGFDVRILETFPFNRMLPANIIFELPAVRDARFAAFLSRLGAHGYSLFLSGSDAMAIRRDRGMI